MVSVLQHINKSVAISQVVDHTTGWAYWASLLEPGEASSYLLDAAEMTAAIEDDQRLLLLWYPWTANLLAPAIVMIF